MTKEAVAGLVRSSFDAHEVEYAMSDAEVVDEVVYDFWDDITEHR